MGESALGTTVLNTIAHFCLLSIIEAINCSDEITRYAANSFKPKPFLPFKFFATATWAMIADDSVISTHRVTIYRVINGSVSDSLFTHESDDFLEGLKVGCRISVHLNIGDMSCICKCMVWCFRADFVKDRNYWYSTLCP